MAGKLKEGKFDSVTVHFDPLPQPLTAQQLDAQPYNSTYSLGEHVGTILPPPPPGAIYTDLLPTDVVATSWDVRSEGWFAVRADIEQLLARGNGVYTIVVMADMNGEMVRASNYSISVK
jgi:hypothetical protein